MQFADVIPFHYKLKISSLKSGNDVIQCNDLLTEPKCYFYLKQKETRKCELHFVCCISEPNFLYAEIFRNSPDYGVAKPAFIIRRFDEKTSDQTVETILLPTIGKHSGYLAPTVTIAGEAKLEVFKGVTFFGPDPSSDVMFSVEDQLLYLHRSILSKSSPVFESMLMGHFMEANDRTKVISLPEKSLTLFIEFLATIYPPLLEIHSSRAKNLLPLYAEYQMIHMMDKCEKSLLNCALYECDNIVDNLDEMDSAPEILEEVIEHAKLADLYNLKSLQKRAVSLLSRLPSDTPYIQPGLSQYLPDSICCLVYSSRVGQLEKKIYRLNTELETLKRLES